MSNIVDLREENSISFLQNQTQIKMISNINRLLKKNYSYSFHLLKSLTRLIPTNFKNKLDLMIIILAKLVNSSSKGSAWNMIKKYVQNKQNKKIKGIFIMKSIIQRKVITKSMKVMQKLSQAIPLKKEISKPIEYKINQFNSFKNNSNINLQVNLNASHVNIQRQKQQKLQSEMLYHLQLRQKLGAKSINSIFNRIKKVKLLIAFQKIQNCQKTESKLLSKLKFVFTFQYYLQKLKLQLAFQFLQKVKFTKIQTQSHKWQHPNTISSFQHKHLQVQQNEQSYNPQLKTKIQCIKTISTCIRKNTQKANKMINTIKNQIRTQKLVNALQAIQDRYERMVFFELFYRTGQLFMEDCQESKVQILQKQIQALRQSLD